ncbi:MAG: hypothetical protein ABWX83_15515 [Luteibacter sp.]
MLGTVRWYHPELRMALVELNDWFVVGAVEEGECAIGDTLSGEFRRDEVEQLRNGRTGEPVLVHIEAERVSEEQANDLLSLLRH